jgi:hypothetical protein
VLVARGSSDEAVGLVSEAIRLDEKGNVASAEQARARLQDLERE